jgi:hypothetical protein
MPITLKFFFVYFSMTYYFKYVCTQGLFSCIPLIRNFVLSILDYLPFKHFKSEYVQLLHAIFANIWGMLSFDILTQHAWFPPLIYSKFLTLWPFCITLFNDRSHVSFFGLNTNFCYWLTSKSVWAFYYYYIASSIHLFVHHLIFHFQVFHLLSVHHFELCFELFFSILCYRRACRHILNQNFNFKNILQNLLYWNYYTLCHHFKSQLKWSGMKTTYMFV